MAECLWFLHNVFWFLHRGKWGIHNDRGACEMGKLGLGGLKRDVKVSFGFRTTSFDFRTACEMELGVRNGFIGPLGFHTVFRTVLGVQNFRMLNENFTDCAKWVRRVNLFLHSVRNWFIGCAKFLHPMRNEPWISQGVPIVLVFPLRRIFKDTPNYFEVPPAIDHKKPKLNQTKIKLKREIKIKTINNTGKLSNKK